MKKIIILLFIVLVSIESIFATNYYQEKLNTKDNHLYTKILSALLEEKDSIEIDTDYSSADIQKVFDFVFKDNPQIFYANQSYNYKWKEESNGKKVSANIEFSYKTFDRSIKYERDLVEKKVLKYVDILKKLDSPYQQIRTMYKYFALTRNYDLSLIDDQSAYSVLINKRGVCASYARAFQYIMNSLGIPCIVVTGELKGIPHAWNMVEIENLWYHIDVTNGNSGYDDYYSYEFFLLPTALMGKSVTIDNDIPEANSDKYNYFKNNSLYFSSFNEFIISNRIIDAVSKGEKGITLNFKDKKDLVKAQDYLINKQYIYSLIETNNISYSSNRNRNLLTIHF
ncbi:MAG: hypothetical protein JJE21_08530 [Spirochaetaceae bacterium]|nr:hypothetical protein [Spirochaetaceae bacterium]